MIYQPRCLVVFDAQQKHNISHFLNFASSFFEISSFFWGSSLRFKKKLFACYISPVSHPHQAQREYNISSFYVFASSFLHFSGKKSRIFHKKLPAAVATNHFERSSTGSAAHGARAFCLRKTKFDKITFSRSYFLPLQKLKKQTFFLFYGISVRFSSKRHVF